MKFTALTTVFLVASTAFGITIPRNLHIEVDVSDEGQVLDPQVESVSDQFRGLGADQEHLLAPIIYAGDYHIVSDVNPSYAMSAAEWPVGPVLLQPEENKSWVTIKVGQVAGGLYNFSTSTGQPIGIKGGLLYSGQKEQAFFTFTYKDYRTYIITCISPGSYGVVGADIGQGAGMPAGILPPGGVQAWRFRLQ